MSGLALNHYIFVFFNGSATLVLVVSFHDPVECSALAAFPHCYLSFLFFKKHWPGVFLGSKKNQ